ncbi:hypothetical protein FOH38_05365 [Lysinibacillus fusiformis]|nr:hypothetical protein FOH38_05365 [Lysinibacillus fusiformis]
MAEHYRFMDPVQREDGTYDREYSAQEFTDYFKALITTGVMKGAGSLLAVSTKGSNMITTIDTGIAFLLGRYYENNSSLALTHDTETLGNRRIDRIVIRMDLNTEARYVKAFIKKGVPSSTPVAPTLTQTQTVYEISLAKVLIVGGQTYISNSDITDERGADIICPWAGSKILPSFDNNMLEQHMNDVKPHVYYIGQAVYTSESGGMPILEITLPNNVTLTDGVGIAFKCPKHHTGTLSAHIRISGKLHILKKSTGSNLTNLVQDTIYTVRYNASSTNFILQGEGGEYGTATTSQVLSPYTIGTESGIVTGTITDYSNSTSIGTLRAGGTGYLDVSPIAGYYNGTSLSRTRLTNSSFDTSNIRHGINIFGLTGTFTGQEANKSFSYAFSTTTSVNIPISFNAGFPIKAYVIVVHNLKYYGSSYTSTCGIIRNRNSGGSLIFGGVNGVLNITNYVTGEGTASLGGSVGLVCSSNVFGGTYSMEIICWG